MTFELSEEHEAFRRSVRDFADKEVAPHVAAWDKAHHFPVDLTPFGLDNPNEVFFAADRPYGLIEGTVRRLAEPAQVLADPTRLLQVIDNILDNASAGIMAIPAAENPPSPGSSPPCGM